MGFALLPSLLVSAVAGCTSVPLQPDNSLASYDGLTKVDGRIRKAEYKAVPEDLNVSKTVYIEPTLVSPTAAQSSIKPADQALVATVVSRALCIGVSDRFAVTDNRKNADLVVHATVTRIVPTNVTAAGLSTAASIGASFAASSVPVPRIPLGLGGLAVEAEATTRDGKQAGAMVWSKGANFVTTGARMSQVGDAYSLASSFGDDFSKMLVTGKTPFKFGFPKLPSYQKLKSNLGGKPKYQACERFGRDPGLKDFAASQVGLPPSWTDKPARQ
ncbi:MAG: DUF3313 domain-containing protein [Mesorhizobium sp.]|nr:MAG: DUF3313 domain-containing protein [Mesorhizobium sp.]